MENDKAESAQQSMNPPSETLRKGAGALRGSGEIFSANPVTATDIIVPNPNNGLFHFGKRTHSQTSLSHGLSKERLWHLQTLPLH